MISGTVNLKKQVWEFCIYHGAVIVNHRNELVFSCQETVRQLSPWRSPIFLDADLIEVVRDNPGKNISIYLKRKRKRLIASFHRTK